ncbi:MAG TPA: hypothetical protein VG815_00175, partial [Chloroflexota bacterium]|nr:hypothetical protein [Chloroflexota bacterium]
MPAPVALGDLVQAEGAPRNVSIGAGGAICQSRGDIKPFPLVPPGFLSSWYSLLRDDHHLMSGGEYNVQSIRAVSLPVRLILVSRIAMQG